MRSRSELRWVGLILAVLGLAVGGCGTFSGGGNSSSALLASASVPAGPFPRATAESAQLSVPEPVAAAAPAESKAEDMASPPPPAESLTTSPAFSIATLEPMPAQSAIPYTIAYAGSEPGADAVVAQNTTPSGGSAAAADTEPQEYDPWEPFNEKMFAFNYNFDKYLLKPVAKGYNFIVPDEIQRMIGNAFDNINPVPKWVNNLLQLNFKGFFTEMGRFLINSTLGIGGLWDIAKQEFGLQKTKVDFGQTLGKWGAGPGPFLILPFLPPLTVRDGIGYGVDGAMDPLSYVLPFIWDRLAMKIGQTINDRSLNLDLFQGFEETTVDLYSAVRNGYLQRRYNLIHNE